MLFTKDIAIQNADQITKAKNWCNIKRTSISEKHELQIKALQMSQKQN